MSSCPAPVPADLTNPVPDIGEVVSVSGPAFGEPGPHDYWVVGWLRATRYGMRRCGRDRADGLLVTGVRETVVLLSDSRVTRTGTYAPLAGDFLAQRREGWARRILSVSNPYTDRWSDHPSMRDALFPGGVDHLPEE